jgi:hypothetical protein
MMDTMQLQLQNLHFLVAEADPVQRRALIEALGQLGATRVTDVPDGPTALRTLQASFTPKGRRRHHRPRPGRHGRPGAAARDCRAQVGGAVIVIGAQPASVLFSVETLAQAYGVDLLGTVAKPVTSAKLKVLLDNFQPPARPRANPGHRRRSALPKSASACSSASSNPSSSPRSSWPPAR